MEEHRKRVRYLVGAFDRHHVDQSPWLVGISTSARIPGGATQPFDVVVQIRAAGLGDNLTQQAAEEPYIVVQRRKLIRPSSRHG